MSIEIKGLEEARQTLQNLEKFASPSNMKKIMKTVGNMVYNVTMESFENERSPFGEKWKSLSDSTKKAKEGYSYSTKKAKKGKGKILRLSGDLEDKWNIKATSTQVEITGNTESEKGYAYGAVHQWGSKRVEARKFLPIDDTGYLEDNLKNAIEDMLLSEALKRLD